MTAAVCARCEAMVTKASTMPMMPTITLTARVKASAPCSCEAWISTSAMFTFRGEGIPRHFLERGENNVSQGPQVRRGLVQVGNLDHGHAGGVCCAHPVLRVLHRQTGSGIHAQHLRGLA